MSQERTFQVGVGYFDGYDMKFEEVPGLISSSIQSDVDKAVGIQMGYGNLSLSYSRKLAGEGNDDYFSLDFMAAGYGVQAQYFNLSRPMAYRFVKGEEGHWAYENEEGTTSKPGYLRTFIVDAFYAFNRRTFAYSAAYKGNLFQRRSAGSWMFGTKLILGEYGMDPSEEILNWSGDQAR